MLCPYCKNENNSVLESREADDGESVRRRRECKACGKRFTTYERVEGVDMRVIKKDGTIEPFEREKIKRGLVKATWKRPVKLEEIEELIDEVEEKLRFRKTTNIRSWEIGKLVVSRLKRIDPLSYLLFASVYRDFESVEDFMREIENLKQENGKRKKVKVRRATI